MKAMDGRRDSETPSSSGSDFYTTPQGQLVHAPVDAPTAQPLPPVIQNGVASAASISEDGESSEMDVSMSSGSSSPEPMPDAPDRARVKRKLSDSPDGEVMLLEDATKKRKVSCEPSPDQSAVERWTTELWQQVFLHLSPAMLCRCLRVSKRFNATLTNTKVQPTTKENKGKPRVMDSESLWIQARKNFMPNMPRPLAGFNEWQMLELLGGRICQFCRRRPVPVPATTPFNAGPGPDGLRVIWPFGIRTCGQCFEHNTIKDVQILVSPAASLRFGLPYAFRTPDLHFVPEMTRQLPGGIPSHLRVAKVYHSADVETIQHEYEEAKAFGQGAAEEWRKGLAMKGKDAMADAARWEKWESQVHIGADLAQVLRGYDLSSFPSRTRVQGRSAGVCEVQATPVPHGTHALPQPVHTFHNGSLAHPHVLPRPLRNAHEVEEARQARKADIERRCSQLTPPLEPQVLRHIESFQAAMQITTPLNDAQWEMLRPRLLAQREAAELVEHQKAEQIAALRAVIPSGLEETLTKTIKDVYDREYEQSQEPLRKRLGAYADELINGQWHGGQGLNRDSAPNFAIQTLLHVRKRFLEDEVPGTSILSLDNMKWVFDNKVRTLTDQYRRELFVCAGCAEDRKPKWFAFEGLIQHYGAKHTATFSKGNIVVHWQTAEWPDEPPFHPDIAPFIKLDRKVSESKAQLRARGASQQTPTLLSENPLFRQPFNFPDMSYEAQFAKLSTDAHEVWEALEGVPGLLECVRVQTVICHVATRFAERFHQSPGLDLLTDSLATNPLMRDIKNSHGLACKICVASQTDGSSYFARVRNVKLYNASSLITHFKILHAGPDWLKDMIELPETQLVSELIRAPGMDDEKLMLIAEAFPEAFPNPLPQIGEVKEVAVEIGPDSGLANRLLGRLTKKPQQIRRKKGRQGSQELLPPAENEYDPRRPMFDNHAADPARFDTDVARKAQSPYDLAPETLAALNSLSTMTARRSPSVPTPTANPVVQPDIAAILRSLTAQQPPAQPPVLGNTKYRTSAEPPSAHAAEFRIALSRNGSHYEQNQHPLHANVAAPPSPPRYQYAYQYDGLSHTQPPVYRQETGMPMQYIQLQPDYHPHHQSQPYSHEYRPALKPTYVDEYGRPVELIPVEYAPHPYGQQQHRYAHHAQSDPFAPHYQPVYYEQARPMQAFDQDQERESVPRS